MNHSIDQITSEQQDLRFSQKVRTTLSDYVASVRMFSRNSRLYLVGSFLMGINAHIFQLLLNLYLKEMGFGESQIGFVVSGRAIGMTMAAIPVAILLSRIKLKPVLITGAILLSVFTFFITSMEMLGLLIGFSILAGISFSFFRVASGPFFMRNSTSTERTHLFSISFGMILLAGMVGSLFSGKIVLIIADLTGDIILGYRYTLYLGIVSSLLALIPFSKVKAKTPSVEENKIVLSLKQLRRRGVYYLKISSANFIVGLGAGLVIPFLNLYFRDRFNQPPDRITFYYFLAHLVMLMGILTGPIIAKKIGLVRAVVTTQLCSIPFMFILSYSYVLPLVLVAFALRAGLMNIGVPIITNLGMELSHKKEQGLVNALLMIAWTSSWMISAAVGGVLIEKYGYTVTINTTIGLYVFSSVMFYFLFRNAESKDGSRQWNIVREEVE